MAHVRVNVLGEGQHPSERMITLMTAQGIQETVIVDQDSIENGTIDIGFPVGSDGQRLLVELPRETTSGKWRVWVDKTEVLTGVPA